MFPRVRALREDHDFSQERLATMLHLSQGGYSSYETGRRNLPIDTLIKLADLYGTSIDYLVGRTDECAPYPPKKSRPGWLPK